MLGKGDIDTCHIAIGISRGVNGSSVCKLFIFQDAAQRIRGERGYLAAFQKKQYLEKGSCYFINFSIN